MQTRKSSFSHKSMSLKVYQTPKHSTDIMRQDSEVEPLFCRATLRGLWVRTQPEVARTSLSGRQHVLSFAYHTRSVKELNIFVKTENI